MVRTWPGRLIATPGGVLFGAALGVSAPCGAAPARAQASLTPPAGNVLFLSTTGVGTQNYICVPAGSSGATTFKATGPQSGLSVPLGGRSSLEVAENILAAVPGQTSTPSPGCVEAADGTRQYCPTWRSPRDQSAVYGTTVASVRAGSGGPCPNAGAVSCLLLKSLATTNGQVTPGLLGAVSYIQRLDTVGGSAPATPCGVGQISQVPYSATYNFYTARR